jgi:hypothetical protein
MQDFIFAFLGASIAFAVWVGIAYFIYAFWMLRKEYIAIHEIAQLTKRIENLENLIKNDKS